MNKNVIVNYGTIVFLGLVLLIYACDADNSGNNNDIKPTEKFKGFYEIESTHISGIHTIYDSLGQIVFQGNSTTIHTNEILEIKSSNHPDTLIIKSLINDLSELRTEVKGIVENDSLIIIYDDSQPLIRNNFIRGKIWIAEDKINLNYDWDKSDIWSPDALPENGEVESFGIKN